MKSDTTMPTENVVGVAHPRLVRRCPKCNCGRWRHVGEIARVGISTSGKAWREVDMKIVECMKCNHSWDILTEDSESSPTNVKEHAPLSAGASVDHGVEVETTGEHINRAADRGCCGSSCSALRIHLTLTSILGLDGPSLMSKNIVAGT